MRERAAIETKLKRKIDTRLMPMIVIMYIMNNLDRNNIAAAKLAGLPKDLGLKGAEYQVSLNVIIISDDTNSFLKIVDCFRSICWLPSHASSFKSLPE